ncbi:MAG: hypothetical protein QOG72_1246 [Sphingomonadales bacterium]|jgi:hypothetical protein|nr:hypothetical protein [Sphingomonadales bacterium]
MIVDWKKDLGKEKSLRQVYRASRRLPKSDFNKFIYAISGIVITGVCTIWVVQKQVEVSYGAVMRVSELAFDLSAQILGFLIGGFAIFATVTDDRLMVRLAQTPMGDSGLSVFKNVFFNFISVFYIFIATLSCSIAIQVISVSRIIDISTLASEECGKTLMVFLNSLTFAVMAGLMVFAVVRLKSFIWNIYQAFITFLGVSDLMNKETATPSQDGPPSA